MVFCLHDLFFFLTPAVQLFHIQKSSTDFQQTACLAVCLLPPPFLFETIAAGHHPLSLTRRRPGKTVRDDIFWNMPGSLTGGEDIINATNLWIYVHFFDKWNLQMKHFWHLKLNTWTMNDGLLDTPDGKFPRSGRFTADINQEKRPWEEKKKKKNLGGRWSSQEKTELGRAPSLLFIIDNFLCQLSHLVKAWSKNVHSSHWAKPQFLCSSLNAKMSPSFL